MWSVDFLLTSNLAIASSSASPGCYVQVRKSDNSPEVNPFQRVPLPTASDMCNRLANTVRSYSSLGDPHAPLQQKAVWLLGSGDTVIEVSVK